MKQTLKISDMFVIFIWLSFLLGTFSQLINESSHPYCFLTAALCFCSIVLLGFKLKLRTGTISSSLLTGTLSLISSTMFFLAQRFITSSLFSGFFTFISFVAICISAVLVFFRLLGGAARNENGKLTAGQMLEYLAPSSCSAIYLVCFVGFVIAGKVPSEWFSTLLWSILFMTIPLLALAFFLIERKFQNN